MIYGEKGNLNINLTDVPSGLYLVRVSNFFETTTKRITKR